MAPKRSNKAPAGPKARKTRFYWTVAHDIKMLHASLDERPWEYGSEVWKSIAEKVAPKQLTPRACKLRFGHLVDLYKKRELQNLRKSGTEEEFNERDSLLEECSSLQDSCPNNIMQAVNEGEEESPGDIDLELEDQIDDEHVEIPIVELFDTSSAEDMAPIAGPAPKKKLLQKKVSDKSEGDLIRQMGLRNTLEANIAEGPMQKRSRKGADFKEIFSQKAAIEREKLQIDENDKKAKLEVQFKVEEKRIDMEERLGMKKLELDFEDRERQRKFQLEQQDREHARNLEVQRLNQQGQDRMFQIMELLAKK